MIQPPAMIWSREKGPLRVAVLIGVVIASCIACSGDDDGASKRAGADNPNATPGGDGGVPGGPGGPNDPGVVTGNFPWPVWDGTTPAVQPSTTGKTYWVDGKAGADSNAGTDAAPFKSIKKALSVIATGDTVLIHGGLYREGIDLTNKPSGAEGKPITFGSVGDGPVILDGSTPVTGWTKVNGSVWKAPITFTPIAIVVNDVPLKQVRQGQQGSAAPKEGIAGVTSGSGKWGYDAGPKEIVADFGSVDPNAADIVVPNNERAQQHVYFYGNNWLVFKGLTVRGSGAAGIWGYGSHITIESCDVKFNGKQGISFLSEGGVPPSTDDAVITSRVYHNVLVNWPRGNNGFAESGGGWPGALSFSYVLRPIARGNLVHFNGGEGVLAYGTDAGWPSGKALFEQNIIVDNWSVNLYFDNQPDDVARSNIIFNHPPDPNSYLYVSDQEPWSVLEKYTVGIMLADEENSSDATNDYANLAGAQVYNNLIAGCRIGIRDYSEGDAHTNKHHGLKNALIANNTIIMPFAKLKNTDTMGIFLQDNAGRNVDTVIQNNLVYGFNDDPVIWTESSKGLPGITLDNNVYFSSAAKPFRRSETSSDFAGWRAQMASDAHGVFADPQLVDVAHFRGPAPYDWRKADLGPSSPARGVGAPQSAFATNLANVKRDAWNAGAF